MEGTNEEEIYFNEKEKERLIRLEEIYGKDVNVPTIKNK